MTAKVRPATDDERTIYATETPDLRTRIEQASERDREAMRKALGQQPTDKGNKQ